MHKLLFSTLAIVSSSIAADIRGTVVVANAANPASVVVFLDNVPGSYSPPVEPIVLDQYSLRFVPHVLAVLVGTTVVFPNSDETRHNVFSSSPAKRFNLGMYPPGASRKVRFDQPGEVDLLCNVHPEMSAYVIVLQNPFFAVTNKDGRFVLPKVPPGSQVIKTWREGSKPVMKEIVVTDHRDLDICLKVN